jgi:hypothetical protein
MTSTGAGGSMSGATGGASGSGGAGAFDGGAIDASVVADAAAEGDSQTDSPWPRRDSRPPEVCGDQGGAVFPDEFRDNVWLVGWSGGLDHFSWFRLTFASPTDFSGTAWIISAGGSPATTSYFPCEGRDGLFRVDPATKQIVLQLPQSCAGTGFTYAILDLVCFNATSPLLPGSYLKATLWDGVRRLDGHRFASDHCGANFTSCPSFP